MNRINQIRCCCYISLAALLTACKKDGLVDRSEPAAATRVMFVHAVPEAVQFNFFVDGLKLTGAIVNASTELPQGMGYNTANQPAYFGYAGITEGTKRLEAIVPQNYGIAPPDTIYAGTPVLDTAFNAAAGKSYTVLAYGTAGEVSSLILEDALVRENGFAGIRFINLMPGTTAVDLEMTYTPFGSTTPTTSLFATNIAYKGVADFQSLSPGTYVFQRKRTGTNTLVGSATTFTRLNAGQHFTLCARGTLAALLQIPHQ